MLTLTLNHSFFYLCGADIADCALTYDIARDKLILWIPYVEPRQVLWFGSKPSAAECLRRLDVDDARYVAQLPKYLKHTACSSQAPVTYILHEDQAPDVAVHRVDASALLPAMDRARSVKTDYEVSMIRRANAISSAAHRRIARYLRRMSSERHVEALVLAVCTARGARSQAYPVIAGSGENGAVLHYGANDQPLAGKQSIVIDAGCEWNCYASDVTRTMPLSGAWSANGAAVHDIVQRMQDRCIAAVRPGVDFTKVHLLAASICLDGLLDLGILKGSKDDIAKAGTITAFFPHGLGHHVGLEVHDKSGAQVKPASLADLEHGKRAMVSPAMMSDLVQARLAPDTRPLEPNMVLTVEPGM